MNPRTFLTFGRIEKLLGFHCAELGLKVCNLKEREVNGNPFISLQN